MTVNEWLRDEAIRHALDLKKFSTGVVRRIVAVLNRTDARMFAELTEALERLDPASFTVERLDALLRSVRTLNAAAYEAVGRELTDVLKDFTAYEVAYQHQMLIAALPVRVSVAAVSAEVVYSAALARPFQGLLLREVWKDLGDKRMRLVRQTIAQGFVESKTTAAIIRELRGTRMKGYSDGLVNRSRREVETVVRTALGHHAGFVRDRMVEANADLIASEVWLSSLDLKTSTMCIVRDQLEYEPVTHKPIGHNVPWLAGPSRLHWNCRSTSYMRTKSWSELTGIPGIPEFTPETRASMDGQVPAKMGYATWLSKQSAARQDEVLGPVRGKLLREGKLGVKDMYDSKGSFLTLDQLRGRDAEAFKRAGL